MLPKTHAPEFPAGLDWFNVSAPLSLEKLRGKIVLLDFWTYCCINCMHVLPDLKRLEQKYRGELAVVGVHCAKFPNERNGANIRQAILRYEIEHPVVNDHTFSIWRLYGVRAWPTMALIDPCGEVVGTISGEGNWDFLNETIGALAREHAARGTLKRGVLPEMHPEAAAQKRILNYPGKLIADPDGKKLFISDSNNNRVLMADLSGKILEAFEGFNHPQGMCLIGENLFVADTENHSICRVDLAAKKVETVAGTGKQAAPFATPGDPMTTHLNSPWDLAAVPGGTGKSGADKILIAMAGSHQIWLFDLKENKIGPFAGTGQERLVDGPLAGSCWAQPSGLSLSGHHLYVADSETSSIRQLDLNTGEVTTLVGIALFDFGDVDGVGNQVRLQHPIGLHAFGEKIFVADTYNHKIKLLNPNTRECFIIDANAQLYEPCGLWVVPPYLYIADTNNHRIVKMFLEDRVVSEVRLSS